MYGSVQTLTINIKTSQNCLGEMSNRLRLPPGDTENSERVNYKNCNRI